MSKDGEILNPRSVLAFCKYFGESVVATAFELDVENNAELAETLTELSMSLVFTRIEPTITNYLRMVSPLQCLSVPIIAYLCILKFHSLS